MKLKLPEGDFRAYLFDCDGTIADSMPLHYKAWKKALAEYGCNYDEDLFYAWGGKPVRKIIADLNEMHGVNMPVDTLAEHKEKLLSRPVAGVARDSRGDRAHRGAARADSVCGCFGEPAQSVIGSLTALGLLDKFDVLVCAED